MSNDKNLKVIKASAGSGKTYQLALEYIKQLLFAPGTGGKLQPRRDLKAPGGKAVNAHRKILAITFTKKATGEMKDRIIQELHMLSRPGGKSKYLNEYKAQSGLNEDQVRLLARLALQELLFDYSNFNVSTIDSFFQGILRNFARELDRDFSYELELEEDYAMRVAVHNFLLSLGRHGKVTKMEQWVKQYQWEMAHSEPDKARWKFFDDGGDLFDFARKMTSETFRTRMDDIRKYLKTHENAGRASDFSNIDGFQKYITGLIRDLETKKTANLEQLRNALASLSANLWTRRTFANWYNDNQGKKADELTDLPDNWKDKYQSSIASQFSKIKLSDQQINQLTDLVRTHYNYAVLVSLFKHINKRLGLLGMLAAIDHHLEQYRHDTNCILIGDTNELIGAVLESGSEFVYERVGTTISNFMIDEFQDTSAKQYENFKSLIKESLAYGRFNMLIGDAKQSIYRFRNADPTVFRELVENDFSENIDRGATDKSTNYRSSRHIVEFNNALFVNMRNNYRDYSTVVNTYKDVEQNLPDNVDKDKVPGYVRVNIGNYERLLDDKVIADAAAKEDKDCNETDTLLKALPGYLLRLHERFDWRQIGILVNTRTDGGKVVESILKYNKNADADKQINIISGESLLLSNSPVICRIIAMLRFIDICYFSAGEEADAYDEGTCIIPEWQKRMGKRLKSDQRLYSALGAFIKETAEVDHNDAEANGQILLQCFEQIDQAVATQDQSAVSYEQLVKDMLPGEGELTTLVSIVENIIGRFKADECNGGTIDREAAFLLAFQDVVKDFCAKRNGGTVREFLKFWDAKKEKLSVPDADNGDSINIMTIHKSKGLEFDCVVIPYAKWELSTNPKETEYWMPKEALIDMLKPFGINGDQEKLVPPLVNVNKSCLEWMLKAGTLDGEARDFVSAQVSDTMIDNLNKTYVAFTRAGIELHIFAPYKEPKNNKKDSPTGIYKTVVDLLRAFSAEFSGMMPVPVADGSVISWYEMGKISTKQEIEALKNKQADAAAGDKEDTTPVAQVKQEVVNTYHVTKMPGQVIVKVENASSSSIAAGKRLHGLLSRIGNSNDVDRVIRDAVKHGSITANPDDACNIDFVNEHVVKPIKDADGMIGKWFDPENKVYAERTVTTANHSAEGGSDIENLRPDRIIRRPDGTWIVIDYKSGELSVEDKDNPGQYIDFTGKYCLQVRRYIERLRATGLVDPVVGRIWFIKHNTVLDEWGKQL